MQRELNFGDALQILKIGGKVARKGWNGKGMHVRRVNLITTNNIPIDNECLILKNVNGCYNTWIPSITDIFAEDWEVI